ncbi:glycosyltransferase family 39 protein [Paenibacillus sp. HB172176]|uniref:ArnT family glycosyltransferase n=1 Tax=Paenibacillus sp. HB172176 TaxID=2493690 RepID=UPI00143B6293|nr:glycosyltransferase family 39 protein [Paenibacillus sp. HB172176]
MLHTLRSWLTHHPLAALLLLIGIVMRVAAAGEIPPGLNQDEASIGYDAYAILHYGIDRNGMHLPVHLIAWGSGQNALYAYFSMPFILLFGLNEWTVRAVSMAAGIVSLWLFYRIAAKLFQNEKGALMALFLIVVCPWHIMMSRWALESNLFPTLVLGAFYCLLKGMERSQWLYGFTLMLALSLYAYGTAYFFVPVFAAATAVYMLATKRMRPLTLLVHVGILFVLASPILLFVLLNKGGGASVSTWLFTIPKLTVPRTEQVSSVFSGEAVQNSLEHLQAFLKLMYTQNDGLPWNVLGDYGYLYSIALPFIAIGLLAAIHTAFKNKSFPWMILVLWLLAAILVAAVTAVNINRINIIFYPIIFLAASGILWISRNIERSMLLVLPAFIVFFSLFSWHYYTDYRKQMSPLFYESFGDAVKYASGSTQGDVHITTSVNMPYIYVLFYERTDPGLFLSQVVYSNPGAAFQQVESFGRYSFGDLTLHPEQHAAYIFGRGDPLPKQEELVGYTVKSFKHYTVVSN